MRMFSIYLTPIDDNSDFVAVCHIENIDDNL